MTDEFRDDSDRRETIEPSADANASSVEDARAQRRAERRRRVRERTFDTTVASPCIAVCQLGPDDLCVGCLRSIDEIRDWPIMTADEKRTVLDRIDARKTD
ncbi:DUF1289 domain-containing protein [Rhodovibrio salinarum]|uniref:DUF1289 domain-containing protein n=1 Tax=Rhodovibrio salinarum TaxID=1087 RepID=UPI001C06628E|nr:DUF1289 domain-containing protein [Rhodovibrio salinarum]